MANVAESPTTCVLVRDVIIGGAYGVAPEALPTTVSISAS